MYSYAWYLLLTRYVSHAIQTPQIGGAQAYRSRKHHQAVEQAPNLSQTSTIWHRSPSPSHPCIHRVRSRQTQRSGLQGRSDASLVVIVVVQRLRRPSAVPGGSRMSRQACRRLVPRRKLHRLGRRSAVREPPDDGPLGQLDRPRPLRARDVSQHPLAAGRLAALALVGEVPYLLYLDEVLGLLGAGALGGGGAGRVDTLLLELSLEA